MHGDIVFVAKANDACGRGLSLMVSRDFGDSFEQASFAQYVLSNSWFRNLILS